MAGQFERVTRKIVSSRDAETGFHGTRKCIKRLRAMLLLLRASARKREWRPIYRELGILGRELSPARDLKVMGDTLTALRAFDNNGRLDLAVAVLRAKLDGRRLAIGEALPAEAMARIDETVARLGGDLARLRLRHIGPAQFAEAAGLTYASARTAMKLAYRSGDGVAFHEWRKHVQRHWRHLQLLVPAWPEELNARIVTAAEIAQLIGQDHDLTMLRGFIVGDPQLARDPRLRALLSLIAKRQSELRAQARPLGRRLFAEPSKAFERRLGAYLRTARAMPRMEAAKRDELMDGQAGLTPGLRSKPGG